MILFKSESLIGGKLMKILNYGSLNIDKIYNVSRLVEPGYAKIAKGYEVMSGGKGLNQSVALKKAGFQEVFHAGNIGKNGDFLKYTLLEYGIDISHLTKSNIDTGHAIIQVADDGMHTILVYSGSNYNNKKHEIDQVIDSFEVGDCLLVQNEINNVPYIIEKASQAGMRIFYNPSPFNKEVLNVSLENIETIIVNEYELLMITESKTADEAVKKLSKYNINVLFTKGKAGGTYYGSNKQVIEYKAYEVDEVDTTAVGDVFVGYFVAEVMLNNSIKNALEISAYAAALSTTKVGTVLSIPSIDEVDLHFGEKI